MVSDSLQEIASLDNLKKAYFKLKANLFETPYLDVLSIEFYEKHLTFNLLNIQRKILNTEYYLGKTWEFSVKKDNDENRKLFYHNFEDSLVEIAILNIIGPFFEEKMSPNSFGNRLYCEDDVNDQITKPYWEQQHLFCKNIIQKIEEMKESSWIIKLDVRDFFNSINPETLFEILLRMGVAEDVKNLLERFCQVDTNEGYVGKIIPQGTFIAPFLANIFLNKLDEFIQTYSKDISYFRYVDDCYILFEGEKPQDFYSKVKNFIEIQLLNLKLHPISDNLDKSFIKKASTSTKKEIIRNLRRKDFYRPSLEIDYKNPSIPSKNIEFLELFNLEFKDLENSKFSFSYLTLRLRQFIQTLKKKHPNFSNIQVEQILSNYVTLNRIQSFNKIRQCLLLIFEIHREFQSNFITEFKDLLTNSQKMIRLAFLSILQRYIRDNSYQEYRIFFIEILKSYVTDSEIQNDLEFRKLIGPIILYLEDPSLIAISFENFPYEMIYGFQVISKTLKAEVLDVLRINESEFLHLFSSHLIEFKLMMLKSYKYANQFTLSFTLIQDLLGENNNIQNYQDFQEINHYLLRFIVFCGRLNSVIIQPYIQTKIQEAYFLQILGICILDFINIQNFIDLGIAIGVYNNQLIELKNFLEIHPIQDYLLKINAKLASFAVTLFNSFPFSYIYNNTIFYKEPNQIIEEFNNVSSIASVFASFRQRLLITNIETLRTFIQTFFGGFSMVEDVSYRNNTISITYRIPPNFQQLLEFPEVSLEGSVKTFNVIRKLTTQTEYIHNTYHSPITFLNCHNIFINRSTDEARFFGFFPNFNFETLFYFPKKIDPLLLEADNKTDFRCIGLILSETLLIKSESLALKEIYNQSSDNLFQRTKNYYLRYIIHDKLLSKSDENYSTYEIFRADIDYAIGKMRLYYEDLDDIFLKIDFSIFKLIKIAYYLKNKDNFFLFRKWNEYCYHLFGLEIFRDVNNEVLKKTKDEGLFEARYIRRMSHFSLYIQKFLQFYESQLKNCKKVTPERVAALFSQFEFIFSLFIFFSEWERILNHLITLIRIKIELVLKSKLRKNEIRRFNYSIQDLNLEIDKNQVISYENILQILIKLLNYKPKLDNHEILLMFKTNSEILDFLNFFNRISVIKISDLTHKIPDFEIKNPIESILDWDENTNRDIQKLDDYITLITEYPPNMENINFNKELVVSLTKILYTLNIRIEKRKAIINRVSDVPLLKESLPFKISYGPIYKRRVYLNAPLVPLYFNLEKNQINQKIYAESVSYKIFHSKVDYFYPIKRESYLSMILDVFRRHKKFLLIVIATSVISTVLEIFQSPIFDPQIEIILTIILGSILSFFAIWKEFVDKSHN